MRFYTVHVRPTRPAADPDFVLVKEGFSWPAFVAPLPWLLWHRQWVGLLVWLAGLLVLGWIAMAFDDEVVSALLALFYAFAGALHANDLRRWTLRRNGYRLDAVVGAHNAEEAERRWLDRSDVPFAPPKPAVLGFAP
jgi:hypothetical protein